MSWGAPIRSPLLPPGLCLRRPSWASPILRHSRHRCPQCSSREQAAVLLHSREQAAVLQYTNMTSMRIALLSCVVRWSGFLVVDPPLLGIDARSAVRESRLQPSCIRESRLLSSSIPTCFASALLKYHVVCACVDRRLGSLVVGRPQSLSISAAWPLASLLIPGIPIQRSSGPCRPPRSA